MSLLILTLLNLIYPTTASTWSDVDVPVGLSNCASPPDPRTIVDATSTIACAVLCLVQNCGVFRIVNGTCRIYLEADARTTKIYKTYDSDSNTVELARGRPINASSVLDNNYGWLAVDGNVENFFHSSEDFATDYPWLIVDLQGVFAVEKFRVLPRAGDHWVHFKNVQMFLGDDVPVPAGNFSSYTEVGKITDLKGEQTIWYEFDVIPPRCSHYAAMYKYVPYPHPLYVLEVHELEIWTSY